MKKSDLFTGTNYIDGRFENHTHDYFYKIDPCTKENVGIYPNSNQHEVSLAVDAAQKAFREWRLVSRVKRAELFDNLAQLIKKNLNILVEVISQETGKTINESHAEVMESLHMCQFTASAGRQAYGKVLASEVNEKDAYIIRKPKGIVAVISPFNFPCAIGSFWCAAPALLEGNCVVHKPSQLTPMIAQKVAELYHEAGFPHGVYNLVHGLDDTGRHLVYHENVDCVLFTGSAAVGREIRQHCASTWHKSCSCEMGSKSAVIVFEDADMDIAIDACVASAFKLSGQRCVSSGRLLVAQPLMDQFVQRFLEATSKIIVDNPSVQYESYYGPLISEPALEKVISYNEMVKKDAQAQVLMDYEVRDNGYFITPFVYKTEWRDVPYLKEEVFGPHVAIIPFQSVSEAINIYNDTEYGLALGAITNNFRTMRMVREQCDAGMIYFNGGSIGAESHTMFGGVKKSGYGGASAAGTFHAVTNEITVTVNHDDHITWAQGLST